MVSNLLGNFALVGLGGAIGAMSRYGVSQIGIFDEDPYYYTVVINISGCIIIGVLWALLIHNHAPEYWYLLLLSGVLGGYTTYSAFTLDAMKLIQDGLWERALFYIALTMIGGLGGCALGLFLTEKLLR